MEINNTYTAGIWHVKAGMEERFINEWSAFAKWTDAHFPGNGKGNLLQDQKDLSRFISFGDWKNEEEIMRWRDCAEFKNFVSRVKEICDDFQPNTLKLVSSSK